MRRYLAVAAFVLAACQQDPLGRCGQHADCYVGQECVAGVCARLETDHQVGSRCLRDGDCASWADCAAERCVLTPGMCASGADCAAWQACDGAHACVALAGYCADAAGCEVWEVCNAGHVCENGPGYCASAADCAAWQACDALHACVTAAGFCAAEADCAAWQDCGADHLCALVPGLCGSSADCASWDVCDATYTCVHGPGYCASSADCSPWEECDVAVHACAVAPGFCGTSADCEVWEVCDGTHVCANGPGYCASSADCAAWQQCDAVHACVAAPGFCGADGDCQVWERCNTTSHACENGPWYCASGADCAAWQQCSAVHACVAAPGFCGASEDCQAWQVCNATSHACDTAPGYCATTADCPNWQECDASHTCRIASGCCAVDLDCRSWEECRADHVCIPQPGSCSRNSDCPVPDACDWQTNTCVRADGGCTSDADCSAPETCSALGVCFNGGSGTADWVRRIGSDAPNAMATENTYAYHLACADDGDLVAHVYAGGPVDPGDGVLRSGHLFVSLSAADGTVQWVKALEKAGSVEPAPGGDVVLAGYAPGDLGAGPVPSQFVARLAGDGTVRWQQALTAGPMSVNAMAVSPSGEIVLTGGSWTVVNGSIADSWVLVTKLDATGALAWSTRAIDDAPGIPYSIAFDPAGNVVLAVGRNQIPDPSLRAMSLVVLDGATGARLWKREYGTDAQGGATIAVAPRSLDVGADGTILVAGTIGMDTSFGGALLHPFYGTDAFALKLGPTGDYLWDVQAAATSYSEYEKDARAIRLPDGTTYLSAIYSGAVDVGGFTVGGAELDSWGAYLARIDPDGAVTAVTPFRKFGSQLDLYDLCQADGHIGWIDHHGDRLILGGLPAQSTKVVDAFVARLNP